MAPGAPGFKREKIEIAAALARVPLEVRTKTEDANGETDGETNGIDDAASFGEALTPPSGDSAVTVDVNPSS